jgi:hypothetical protein
MSIDIDKFQTFLSDNRKLQGMDNQELAWVVLRLFSTSDDEVLGRKGLVIDEVVNRLYPEWDGDLVEMTQTGWRTPEGEINYINQQPTSPSGRL